MDHGKNWYEGKKCTTLTFSEKYSKPTYIAEIRFKASDTIWLRMTDFETAGDAQKWINEKKSQSNQLLAKVKIYQPVYASLITEVPLGKTYDDYFKDKVIEMPPLYSLYHEETQDYSKSIEHTNNDFKGDKVTNKTIDNEEPPGSIKNKQGLGNFEDEKNSGGQNREITSPTDKNMRETGLIP